jgi:hypothetical protein
MRSLPHAQHRRPSPRRHLPAALEGLACDGGPDALHLRCCVGSDGVVRFVAHAADPAALAARLKTLLGEFAPRPDLAHCAAGEFSVYGAHPAWIGPPRVPGVDR